MCTSLRARPRAEFATARSTELASLSKQSVNLDMEESSQIKDNILGGGKELKQL